ncbi:MAG: hypothetical protein ICV85_02475 [Tolypothrix sp. T3-bin4]|nr:hypothetical protein [Tolypothrix sp. T3-bin4]
MIDVVTKPGIERSLNYLRRKAILSSEIYATYEQKDSCGSKSVQPKLFAQQA